MAPSDPQVCVRDQLIVTGWRRILDQNNNRADMCVRSVWTKKTDGERMSEKMESGVLVFTDGAQQQTNKTSKSGGAAETEAPSASPPQSVSVLSEPSARSTRTMLTL
ncbi:Hypothetical predicted protein [Xyrichtys novacula]|uniref:Uncharacterized protein n=1 Tax=Xyrichtys novacula TaxID=13765 RepID=A0AAV1GT64_XYRNO|nr:Hypothetical predicted protein [Xyrichtys novacula]